MSGNRAVSVVKCSIATLVILLAPVALAEDKAPEKSKDAKILSCDMTYSLKGWSAVYKTAKGKGTITCANGEKAEVKISIHGGGITFGKTEIVDGKAKISGGHSIEDIYGSYAQASAHAGAGKAADASVLTKGEISIALSGTGTGVDVGVDFSGFKISKADAPDDDDPPKEAPKDKK
jgi:hypothetical protein